VPAAGVEQRERLGGLVLELAIEVLLGGAALDLGDPEVWDSCGLPWCANYSWPWKGSALAESPRAKDKYD